MHDSSPVEVVVAEVESSGGSRLMLTGARRWNYGSSCHSERRAALVSRATLGQQEVQKQPETANDS